MSLQQKLVDMLRESFEVERAEADVLILKPDGGAVRAPVRLLAPESTLADFATKNAKDSLDALGDVGGDDTGALAALSLLSVHIEETLSASRGETVVLLSVSSEGLDVQRTP